jgi:hypothetical protein
VKVGNPASLYFTSSISLKDLSKRPSAVVKCHYLASLYLYWYIAALLACDVFCLILTDAVSDHSTYHCPGYGCDIFSAAFADLIADDSSSYSTDDRAYARIISADLDLLTLLLLYGHDFWLHRYHIDILSQCGQGD